ncbi:MAG: hypothetical protein WBD03_05755 [Thermoplasmata archaeon]
MTDTSRSRLELIGQFVSDTTLLIVAITLGATVVAAAAFLELKRKDAGNLTAGSALVHRSGWRDLMLKPEKR